MDTTWYEEEYEIQDFHQNVNTAMKYLDKAIINLQWLYKWEETHKKYINEQINTLHSKLNELAFWHIDVGKYFNNLRKVSPHE